MKVLITGAKGFIGSHLGNALVSRGDEVIGIDNESHASENPVTFSVLKDDAKNIDLEGIDVVLHLAAHINVDESIEKPIEYFENNVIETVRILEKLRQFPKCKFIYASSAEVYGTAIETPMSEMHPLTPLSPYATSKLSAEEVCKLYADLHKCDITIIRNFNTFGPYQRGDYYGGVIAKFIAQAKAGVPLTVYGSGEQMRDYMHVSQAVTGYMLAIDKKLPLVINFGSGNSVKIIDIAKRIAEKLNARIEHLAPRPNEIKSLKADVSEAISFGYQIQTDFWNHLDELLG